MGSRLLHQLKIGVLHTPVFLKPQDHEGQWEDGTIILNETLVGAELAHTWLHEVLHGLFTVYAVGQLPNEDADTKQQLSEEEIVARLSMAFCMFIRENPTQFRWFMRNLFK